MMLSAAKNEAEEILSKPKKTITEVEKATLYVAIPTVFASVFSDVLVQLEQAKKTFDGLKGGEPTSALALTLRDISFFIYFFISGIRGRKRPKTRRIAKALSKNAKFEMTISLKKINFLFPQKHLEQAKLLEKEEQERKQRQMEEERKRKEEEIQREKEFDSHAK